MKQIHEAVQALESDRILAAILDFVEEAEKRQQNLPGKSPRANMHTANTLKKSNQGCIAILPNFDDSQNEQN